VTADQVEQGIDLRATVVTGGVEMSLMIAMSEQRANRHVLEDAGRKITSADYKTIESSGAIYAVYRTDIRADKTKPHYHTVIFGPAPNGKPYILHWHAWRGSR